MKSDVTAFSSYITQDSPFPVLPFALRAIWAARVRCGSRTWWLVVTRTRRKRAVSQHGWELLDEPGHPANYTIHLVPILRRLYYTEHHRISTAASHSSRSGVSSLLHFSFITSEMKTPKFRESSLQRCFFEQRLFSFLRCRAESRAKVHSIARTDCPCANFHKTTP